MTHPGAQYLAELEASAKKATPGPWHVAEDGLGNKANAPTVYHPGDDLNYVATCADFATFHAPPNNLNNAAHIANASPARIAAIAEYVAAEKARADAAEANCERWRLNSIANYAAFTAMRNTINEVVPMQSAEADLLRGPEQSVACAAIASAVVATIASLTEQLAEARALNKGMKADNKKLRTALKPFANKAESYSNCDPCDAAFGRMNVYVSELRHALSTLSRLEKQEGEA